MRKVGSLSNEDQAEKFRHILLADGIEVHFADEDDQSLDVWVIHDRDIWQARELLAQFMDSPDHESFKSRAQLGRVKKQQSQVIHAATRFRNVNVRTKVFFRPRFDSQFYTTMSLIIMCAGFFVLQYFDKERWLRHQLSISQDPLSYLMGVRNLIEVQQGQIWRLVTPIFIHADFFHILFNMMWLYQFGRQIEEVKGSLHLLMIIIAIAIPSNMAFYYVAGPSFGGMSGVIYGLVFYMWISDRLRYPATFQVDPNLVQFFLIYYVICWVLSVMGFGVANTVHGVGALMGLVCAFFVTGEHKVFFKRPKYFNKDFLYQVLIGVALLVGGMFTDYLTY